MLLFLLDQFELPTPALWPCCCQSAVTSPTFTVAEAVKVLMPVRADEPPFSTTMSVTAFGTPACPGFMVT